MANRHASSRPNPQRPEPYGPTTRSRAMRCGRASGSRRRNRLRPRRNDDKQDKDDDDKHGNKHKKSLAEKRGADWGLRDAARGAVGVTRPIRVECYADRLVVFSDRGPADNKVIALGPRTQSSIKPLISAVWDCMETWGMAGRGMYWRPVLQVYVAPDAEQRFAELSALLEGSGLTVERK